MKISHWIYLLLVNIFLFSSCIHKNVDKLKAESDDTLDMEELLRLYEAKEYQQFIDKVEVEINKSDDDLGLQIGLAVAYGEIGNYEKAFFYARKQLQMDSGDYYAMLVIGDLHQALENPDSAEIYYNRVIELHPTYAQVYLNLAQLYEKEGKKQEAINNYIGAAALFDYNNHKEQVVTISNKVLELDPTNKQAKYFLEKIHIKAPKLE